MKKKHEILRDHILDKILSGDYQVDSLIPKETDLAEKYDVSRPTVRQAIKSLVADGYLERKQRVGTRVIRRKIKQEFTQTVLSFNEEMKKKGLIPETKVISFSKITPPSEVKQALKLDENDMVYSLVRLRFGDHNPVVIVTTYLPTKYLPNLMDYDFGKISLYDVLEEAGYRVSAISRDLEITWADELTSELLNITVNTPLFYFKSIGKTPEDIPIEYSFARYRSDINTFHFEVKLG